MMEKKACKALIVFVVILFLAGCVVSSLQTYKPLSPNEANIKEFLVSEEKAWNERNLVGVLAAYHDNASIMAGKERRMFSKKEYADRLEGKVAGVTGLKNLGGIKYGAPKIRIKKDGTAGVDVSIALYEFQDVTLQAKILLVPSGNSWLIMKRTYTH